MRSGRDSRGQYLACNQCKSSLHPASYLHVLICSHSRKRFVPQASTSWYGGRADRNRSTVCKDLVHNLSLHEVGSEEMLDIHESIVEFRELDALSETHSSNDWLIYFVLQIKICSLSNGPHSHQMAESVPSCSRQLRKEFSWRETSNSSRAS